jgi:ATP-dependent Zn protease
MSKKTIEDAKEAIDKTDEWISYFKTEKGLGSDPRLAPIVTKREFAAEYTADAKNLYDSGKYTEAKKRADEAYKKANEVFTETQELNAELEASPVGFALPDLSGILVYIVGIIVVVIVIFGLLRFMKNRGGRGGGGGGGGSFGSRDRPRKKSTAHQYDELF